MKVYRLALVGCLVLCGCATALPLSDLQPVLATAVTALPGDATKPAPEAAAVTPTPRIVYIERTPVPTQEPEPIPTPTATPIPTPVPTVNCTALIDQYQASTTSIFGPPTGDPMRDSAGNVAREDARTQALVDCYDRNVALVGADNVDICPALRALSIKGFRDITQRYNGLISQASRTNGPGSGAMGGYQDAGIQSLRDQEAQELARYKASLIQKANGKDCGL